MDNLLNEKWNNKLQENLLYIETNIIRIKEILLTSQNKLLSRDITTDEDSLNFNITLEKLGKIKVVIVTENGNIVILVKISCFIKKHIK